MKSLTLPECGATLAAAPLTEKRSRALRLQTGDVEVWSANLDDQPIEAVRVMHALLSADEIERARQFFFDRDRRHYIIGRGILRMLLGRYLACAPHELEFRYGPNGKPALAGGGRRPCLPASVRMERQAETPAAPSEPLFFNIAHSEGLALYAFTRVGEIGIDLEAIRDLPEWEQVAESAFSPQELAQLRSCPTERRREEFFHAWARQEAVLKALGTGLGGALTPVAESCFNVYPLEAGPGFAAALAVSPAARRSGQMLSWGGAAAARDHKTATSTDGDAPTRLHLS